MTAILLVAFGIAVPTALAVAAGTAAKVTSTTVSMFPNPSVEPCLAATGKTPSVSVTVTRGARNDTLVVNLKNFKAGLGFDLFTVQRSNQRANGSPVSGFANFGLAWYQSDIEVGSTGAATVTIKTILLDQIFGFDAGTGLVPTNTFHVGFWFNNPADAASCGFTGSTPFNGEHAAGPLAFITRPLKSTGLGPLCTDPNLLTTPHSCNP
jgi:hypothetical protein